METTTESCTRTGEAASSHGFLSAAREIIGAVWSGVHGVHVSRTSAVASGQSVQDWYVVEDSGRAIEAEYWKARAFVNNAQHQIR